MNLGDLKTLLDYHYWARDRMLDAVALLTPEQFTRDLGNSFGSIRDTVAHIHAAEWAWCSRWHGESPSALLPADRFPDLETVRRDWAEQERKTRAFVERLGEAGVDRMFDYKMTSGAAVVSPFWEMLYHLVNHSTYHRGQVTTMLRQLGAAPPESTDAIGFFRSRQP